jgi:hypothetical protein
MLADGVRLWIDGCSRFSRVCRIRRAGLQSLEERLDHRGVEAIPLPAIEITMPRLRSFARYAFGRY